MKESQSHTPIQKAAMERYYTIKPWESEKLYRALGVRTFQNFLKISPLYKMDGLTLSGVEDLGKKSEIIHALGFAVVETGALIPAYLGKPEIAAAMSLAGIASNIYPIISQRYNRIRINKIREHKSRREEKRNIPPTLDK